MRRILFRWLIFSFLILCVSGFNILFGQDKKPFEEFEEVVKQQPRKSKPPAPVTGTKGRPPAQAATVVRTVTAPAPLEEKTPEKSGPEEKKEPVITPSAQVETVVRQAAAPGVSRPATLVSPFSLRGTGSKAGTPKAEDDPQKKLQDLESERNEAYRYLGDKSNPGKYEEAVKFGWIRSIQDIEKDIETQKKKVPAMPRTAPVARVDTPTAARATIDVEREMGLALRRELSATEVFKEKNVRQIEEASSIKEVSSLSDEQKQFIARLSYQVVGRLEQMSDETLKSIPAEQRIILLRLMNSRAMVINAAAVAVERNEGELKSFEKHMQGTNADPEKVAEQVAKAAAEASSDSQKLFALTPGRTSLAAITEDTQAMQHLLTRLGFESDLHLEVMNEAKMSFDELSKKKTLNRREKEKLEDARNKLFSNFVVLNNAELSPEQSMRALADCRELVEKDPKKAKSFLSELAKKQKKLDSQVAKIDSKIKRVEKTKQYKTLIKQSQEMEELADVQRKLMADKSLSEQARRDASREMQSYAAKANELRQKAWEPLIVLGQEKRKLEKNQKNLNPQIEAFKMVMNKKKYAAELAKLEKVAVEENAKKLLQEKSSTIKVKTRTDRQAPDAPELPAR